MELLRQEGVQFKQFTSGGSHGSVFFSYIADFACGDLGVSNLADHCEPVDMQHQQQDQQRVEGWVQKGFVA